MLRTYRVWEDDGGPVAPEPTTPAPAGRLTYRERREARAEKLDGWAAKRETRAAAEYEAAKQISDMIPFGQPILVGHHSEKRHRKDLGRIHDGFGRSFESAAKATSMSGRAESIRAQADIAIYDDDPDAIERLTEKLAALEAQREQRKAANVAYRKEHKAELKAMHPYDRGQAVPFPSYSITNLGGNISRTKERLARLQREQTTGPRDRVITSKYGGACEDCGAQLERGQLIRYNRQQGARCHVCPTEAG